MEDDETLIDGPPPAFLGNDPQPIATQDSRECDACHKTIEGAPMHVHYDVGGAQRRHLTCCHEAGCPAENEHEKCGHVLAQRELMARA